MVYLLLVKWVSPVVLGIKNPPANAGDSGDAGSIPGSARSPGGRHPIFLPGEFHGKRGLVGCCALGCTESDTPEVT